MPDAIERGLTITTITGDVAVAEVWYGVPDELLTELRGRLGEPTLRQMIPVEVCDEMNAKPSMVILD